MFTVSTSPLGGSFSFRCPGIFAYLHVHKYLCFLVLLVLLLLWCTLSHACRLENDYVMEKCLGKGGFGVVYHVKRKFDSADYAIKIIKLLGK